MKNYPIILTYMVERYDVTVAWRDQGYLGLSEKKLKRSF